MERTEAVQKLQQLVGKELHQLANEYGALNVNQPVAFFAIIYEMNFIKLLDILLC